MFKDGKICLQQTENTKKSDVTGSVRPSPSPFNTTLLYLLRDTTFEREGSSSVSEMGHLVGRPSG